MLRLKLAIKKLKYWLLGIAAALISLHLSLSWKLANSKLLSASLLFWMAVSALLWKKRDALNLESDIVSGCFGTTAIALVLLKSQFLYSGDSFLRIFPFISILGWSLLASGFKGLKQYWQELSLLAFFAIAQGWLFHFELSELTAQFSTFVLWCLRYQVSRQGLLVSLPTGAIEVYAGCSGVGLIMHLIGLAFIFIALFPTNWLQKILLPIAAIFLGFASNGVRVALMAILAASSHKEAFDYWHQGNGSLIFSAIAVLIFGLVCHLLSLQSEQDNRHTTYL